MSYLAPYKRLNQLIQAETFEPLISWGLRMGLAGTIPIIWGLLTGRVGDSVWIALTAEGVSWVEMKGSFSWRVRTLASGAALAFVFSVLGTLTAGYLWLSVAAMFAVGFIATLLKNIGDRASGLAVCVFLMFIICNAFPVATTHDLLHRLAMVLAGAIWPAVVGVAMSLVMPAEEPFRRQIAIIWRAISDLVEAVSKVDGRAGYTKMLVNVYDKEKDVRRAMDNSFMFFGKMAHQVSAKDHQQYQLVQLRKAGGILSANAIAMGEEMEQIAIHELDKSLRIKAGTMFDALREAVRRISIFIITLKPEEKLLAISQINRLRKLAALIREYPMPEHDKQTRAIQRILLLAERNARLMESAIQRVEQMGTDVPVFRSYSLLKTIFILRPKYLLRNLQVLFNFSTFNMRYTLRSAIAATVGMFISLWFHIDHGYWIPFSLMIIIQPYFGATFRKAVDRVVGTLLGGLTGGLLLRLPKGFYLNEMILFMTFVLMVYYSRKRYAIATFVITLNLVLLFNLESAYNSQLMVSRALCTIMGAVLAVVSGFALFPTWDKKWLPRHLADAITCNYDYFITTFFAPHATGWTKDKRNAESKNSNVFDSFNRYMEEPGRQKSETYYDVITYNVRITRILNNIHLEQDEKKPDAAAEKATAAQQDRINECLERYNELLVVLKALMPKTEIRLRVASPGMMTPFVLNDAQQNAVERLIIELIAMKDELAQLDKDDAE